MTLTATKERERHVRWLASKGLPSVWRGGQIWALPKKQFIALCVCTGSFEDALELRPDMIPWPPNTDGTPREKDEEVPPYYVIYGWYREYEAGEVDPDPKLVKRMEERLLARFKIQVRRGIMESSKALQHLAGKVRDGTIDPKQQSQILSLGQAVNYGVGNYAQFHKALEGNSPQSGGFQVGQVGRLIINAPGSGKPREKKKLTSGKPAEQIIEAEVREVV